MANADWEEVLTLGAVREALGHSIRLETEQFLKDRGIFLDMNDEELEDDARAAAYDRVVGSALYNRLLREHWHRLLDGHAPPLR